MGSTVWKVAEEADHCPNIVVSVRVLVRRAEDCVLDISATPEKGAIGPIVATRCYNLCLSLLRQFNDKSSLRLCSEFILAHSLQSAHMHAARAPFRATCDEVWLVLQLGRVPASPDTCRRKSPQPVMICQSGATSHEMARPGWATSMLYTFCASAMAPTSSRWWTGM
jgi:hypothetical protein